MDPARPDMQAFVERLLQHPTLGPMVAHHRRVEARPAAWAEPAGPLPGRLAEALRLHGVERLYAHQARAVDAARQGRNVLAVTPTASGKTLVFALPVLETVLREPGARALFLYPTKALARDQVAALNDLAGGLGALRPPRFEIYDGDTPGSLRKKIKADPPEVLVTNPDMLHLGILAHHRDWERLLGELRYVVLDELHVYRGVFGAHVHHILQRLRRICARLGRRPRFVAASATVGNPAEFAELLTGEPFEVIDRSGAPAAPRQVVFLNPTGVSPYTTAVRVVAECASAGLKTIAFTKARKITELLHTWLVRQAPALAERVAPYRAGYLPHERREIEQRLFRGELTAVLTTSALELGIDVGALDVCVLVGYPGSLISSWQRIGRVGRQDREALVVLIAMPDALDQYLVRHPDLFFGEGFERAVLDPWNRYVAGDHLVCAANEEPLERREIDAAGPRAGEIARTLALEGRLSEDAAGERWYSFRRRPHRRVSVRSAAEPFTIVERRGKRVLGTIDGVRVYHECHPGAIYLHGGQTYLVKEMDTERRRVVAERARVDYYTVVLGEKETEILEVFERRRLAPAVDPAVASSAGAGAGEDTAARAAPAGQVRVGLGRLKVTVHIREYQKKRLFGGEPISTHALDAPPLIFETVGFWIELPGYLPAAFTARELHFMGGIHAAEHAMIGLFPLLAIADRGDIGGISFTGHPQVGAPAIFVYDGHPGGAGLAERGYRDLGSLLERTRQLIADCPCEDGCPSCIQSPKCGNGNKPLDKRAALLVLGVMLGRERIEPPAEFAAAAETAGWPAVPRLAERPPAPPPRAPRRHGVIRSGNLPPSAGGIFVPPARGELPRARPCGASEVPATDRASAASSERTSPVPRERACRVAGVPASRIAKAQWSERETSEPGRAAERPPGAAAIDGERVLVFDLETQRGAAEVGGWGRTFRMGLALGVVYDPARDRWTTYHETDVHRLLLDLVMADLVVGFNIDRFDLEVLGAYTQWDLARIHTCDMMKEIRRRLGYRLSLAHLAEVNLGEAKTGSGLLSLRWWREGRTDLIERYCRKDVELTHRLFRLGRERGYLLYRDREQRTLRVPVTW